MRKGVCVCEYMDDWKKFDETLSPEKDFCSNLKLEDITDADYAHRNKSCKDFKIKNVGKCHDFCVQRNALLLADVFENFRNMCLKIYELGTARFPKAPGLAWQAALKEDQSKIKSII